MEPPRFFDPRQRLALLNESAGLCAGCGVALAPGFHADHVTPFARGGSTDVANGQALCARCNQAKGAGVAVPKGADMAVPKGADMAAPKGDQGPAQPPHAAAAPPPLPPWNQPLRRWQEQGFAVWQRLRAAGRQDALVTATPGSGKTAFACRLLHSEISASRADLAVIVVPSLALKTQWAKAAQPCGLRLCADWGNGALALPADVHGVVVTYAQVGRLPEPVRLLCARRRVFAVADEIHHAGDGLAWGKGLREAFEHASARLCLSGTAWRGDSQSIPFVRYDGAGRSVADIAYSYADALADGVVRDVYFFSQGGQVRWLDEAGEHQATFAETLTPEDRSRRLRAALDTRGQWLPAVLAQASDALAEVRVAHTKAKALVVTMDGAHARAVAAQVARVTGKTPLLALSDNPGAAGALARFRSGSADWLVVCRMAGEGFDCPDLRVCVWASHAADSELWFRQVIGRMLRMVPGLAYQDAQVFLPADPRLLAMARAMLAERAQALGGPQSERENASGGGGGRALFVPLESRAAAGEVVSAGTNISLEALRRAEAFKAGKPDLADYPAHFLARVLRHLEPAACPSFVPGAEGDDRALLGGTVQGESAESALQEGATAEGHPTYDEARLQKRRLCSRLAAIVARADGVTVEEVHRACHQQLGVRQGDASLVDLTRKERLLMDRLLNLQRVPFNLPGTGPTS